MPRRVTLPGASELFRPTDTGHPGVAPADTASAASATADSNLADSNLAASTPANGIAKHSGRVRHDEKITVYVSREELLALEQARILLRGEHNMAVDRGRIVRAAIVLALEGLSNSGPDSDLARRLAS